ncbi:MAG: fibronectin type III domain-containing protein [Firmicutes bacterium]|nr:fibronectin type III domain-containing protein [Bacillota bacterium]
MFKEADNKTLIKRIFAVLICIIFVASMSSTLKHMTVSAAEKDQYGFDISVPSDFDANDGQNPYGQGRQPIGIKHETYISWQEKGKYQASVYNFKNKNRIHDIKAPHGDDKIKNFTGNKTGRFTNAVAYDAYASGKKNYTAEVEFAIRDGSKGYINVFKRNAETGGEKQIEGIYVGDGDNASWFEGIEQWAYKSYFQITAGDFDGDGADELAVYVPDRDGSYVRILNGKNLKKIRDISLEDQVGTLAWKLSTKYSATNKRMANAMVQCNLEADDIDRDGIDDLLIATYFGDIKEDSDSANFSGRATKLGLYNHARSGYPSQMWYLETGNMKDPEKDDRTTKFNMRACDISCGDLDYDGFPEIVLAGFYTYSKISENPGDRDRVRDENFLTATIKYTPGKEGRYSDPTYQFLAFDPFTEDGVGTYNDRDDQQGPPALCCVAMNGRNAKESIFLNGTFYDHDGTKFTAVKTADVASESDNGMGDSTSLSNTWFDEAVAGNFDSNELGVEQVLWTAGYKQDSVEKYLYRVYYAGYTVEEKKGIVQVAVDEESGGKVFLQSGTQNGGSRDGKTFVDWTAKSDDPAIAIAAVDTDNDTEIFEYKSKEYTYADPEVMALLQAAPYFGDLDEAGYGYGDNCSTSIGKSYEEGHSTTTSSSVSAGVVVSADLTLSCLKVSTEASFTHEWAWEYEKETTQSWSWEVENTGKTNKVVLTRTPVVMYHYDVYSPNGKGDLEKHNMAIGIPREPAMMVMNVDKYNEMVKTDPTKSDDYLISTGSSGVERCVPGQPDSYPKSNIGLQNCVTTTENPKTWRVENDGSYTTAQAFEMGNGTTDSQTYTNSLEGTLKYGFSAEGAGNGFEMLWGASIGGSWGGGESTTKMHTVTKSGSVASPPEVDGGLKYGFTWQLATWSDTVGSSDKPQEIPVVGYIVTEVDEPLSIPRDVRIESVTTDTIVVDWEQGYKRPTGYEVYQYIDDPVTGSEYVYLGSTDANTTKFTADKLSPETEYQFSVRAYKLEESRVEYSMYTNPVAATTLGDSEMPIITSQPKDQYVLTGETATFSVTAKPSENASEITYMWQKKDPETNKWVNGVKTSTLTLPNVTNDMDDYQYRVVVGELIKGSSQKVNIYSDIATLHVGRSTTDTTASAVNTDSRDPNEFQGQNRGWASKSEVQTVQDGTKKIDREIDVTIGEDTYTFIVVKNEASDDPDPEYIYNLKDTNDYYALTGFNEDAMTAEAMKQLTQGKKHFTSGLDPDIWTDLSSDDLLFTVGENQVTAELDGKTYDVFTLQSELYFRDNTLNWYEYRPDGEGNYALTKITDNMVNDLLQGAAEPYTVATETIGGNTYLVMVPDGDNYTDDSYKVYKSIDPNDGSYYYKKADGTLEVLTEIIPDGTYSSEDGTINAVPGETVQDDVPNMVDRVVTEGGDEVTLIATVTPKSEGASKEGVVVFNIRNTNTNAVKSVNATSDSAGTATAKWTPEAPGTYEITAVFGGNESTITSSGTTIYYAFDKNTEDPDAASIYALSANGAVYGDKISLKLDQINFDPSGEENHTDMTSYDGVSYQVAYNDLSDTLKEVDLEDNTFTPVATGKHVFVAYEDGKVIASCTVNVIKRPITLTAPSKKGLSAASNPEKVPDITDVVAAYKDNDSKPAFAAADQGKIKIEDVFDLTSTPSLTEDSAAGTYRTELKYKTDEASQNAVNEFKAKYNVTFKEGYFIVEAGVFNVKYEAGSNGSVRGFQGDNKRAFDSGAPLLEGTMVTLSATPDENFKVDEWIVKDAGGNMLQEGTDYIIDGDDIVITALSRGVEAKATFEPAAFKLTFEAKANGSVEGHYYKDSSAGSEMTSPETVANGKSTILTAKPDKGYVVKQWNIAKGGGEPEVYKENGEVFTGKDLILLRLDADTKVTVEFEQEEFYTVSVKFVDEGGVESPAGEINIDGLLNNGTAEKGSALTISTDLPDNVIIKEWRLVKGSGSTVLQGSKPTYRINSVQEDISIEIEVADFKKVSISYKVITDDGGNAGDVIKATSEGVDVVNGGTYTAYIPIDFEAVNLPDKYQVSKWTVTKDEGEESVLSKGWEATKTRLGSLNGNCVVKLYLISRPVLTYGAGANGSIVNNEGLANGDYFYKNRVTDHSFTVKPAKGYEIDEINVTGANGDFVTGMVEGSSDVTLDVKAPEGGFNTDLDVNVTFSPIPAINVDYFLSDIGDGTHGKIKAEVDRNGDDAYVVSKDASADGGSLRDVYRGSVITITDNAAANYKISSWNMNGLEVLGNNNIPDYVSLGSSDDVLKINVTDELIGDIGVGKTLEVAALNNMKGSILTYGAKDNQGGSVIAYKDDGTNVKYGTIFGEEVKLNFKAAPYDNCDIIGWEVNGAVQDEDGSQFEYTVGPDQDVDVRAVFSELQPAPTCKLTYGAVSDDADPHGSVTAAISSMPDPPGKGYYSVADYAKGDLISSGKDLEKTTGVTLTATPEKGYLIKGWYSDPECTKELPGSAEELGKYNISSVSEDQSVYVKFAKIKEFTINVKKEGTGAGSFDVYVDGTKLSTDDFVSASDDAVSFEVARHSNVKVTAHPEGEFNYVAEWNGQTATSNSFELKDIVASGDIVMTILPAELIDIEFDLPSGYSSSEGTVQVGKGDAMKQINAINKRVRDVSGKDVIFTIVPHDNEMVDSWKVKYGDGSVEEGSALGLGNTLKISDLTSSVTVTVTMKDLAAYRLPVDGEHYTIADTKVEPDTLKGDQYENMIRENGTATFSVVPEDGYLIDAVSDRNTDKEAGSNILSIDKKADGGWKIRVSNVMVDIDLDVKAVKSYQIKIAKSSFGKITVVDANKKTIKSGSNVKEGTKLTVTATANTGCQFNFWNAPFKGAGKSVTTTVKSDITFGGEFVRIPITAKVTAQAKTATITWNKVYGADRYLVYRSTCNKAAFSKSYTKVSATKSSYKLTGLKQKGVYKIKVVAQKKVNGKYTNLSTSPVAHFVLTKNKNYTNPKAVTVSIASYGVKVGKTAKIYGKVTKVAAKKKLLSQKHEPTLRYKSSNKKVATVSAKGVITGKKAGRCTIYVSAVNGVWKTIVVTVK